MTPRNTPAPPGAPDGELNSALLHGNLPESGMSLSLAQNGGQQGDMGSTMMMMSMLSSMATGSAAMAPAANTKHQGATSEHIRPSLKDRKHGLESA